MLKENRVLACLSGGRPEQYATEACEVSFLLSFFPRKAKQQCLDTPAQDAARELISNWLREANKISSGWGAIDI